jgi:predicted signal transduction protein with EAL and GGDEF domain
VTLEQLVAASDVALYRAKRAGRNMAVLADGRLNDLAQTVAPVAVAPVAVAPAAVAEPQPVY